MYKLTIDQPNLAKGTEVEVDGLGVFKNGATHDITKEQAAAFRIKHQVVTTETGEDGKMTHTVQPGPTILQAFKGREGFEVETVQDAPPPTPSATPTEPAELAASTEDEKGDEK